MENNVKVKKENNNNDIVKKKSVDKNKVPRVL